MPDLIYLIYVELMKAKPDRVTPAGICYLLRGIEAPPTATEAERSLEWLTGNGRASRYPDKGFGPEYAAKESKS